MAAVDLERGYFAVERWQGLRRVVERNDNAKMRRPVIHFFARQQRVSCQTATIGDGWR
jgi:hypothetical protein